MSYQNNNTTGHQEFAGFPDKTGKSNKYCYLVSWSLSLLLHFLILLTLLAFAWHNSKNHITPGDEGTNVGIITEESDFLTTGNSYINTWQDKTTKPETSSLLPETKITKTTDIQLESFETNTQSNISIDITNPTQQGDSSGSFGDLFAEGSSSGNTASFFGLKAKGDEFIFIVDISGSMSGNNKIISAKKELFRSIAQLNSNMRFMIIFYNDQFVTMPGGKLVKATKANKNKYSRWANKVGTSGGTNPLEAIQLAISLKPDAIWLLSDGLFNASIIDTVKTSNTNNKIQIHTIAFHDNSGEQQLKQIAKDNNGKYRFVAPNNIRR